MRQKTKNRYKNQLIKLTSGLFHNLTDVCLFTIFFHLHSYKIAYGKTSTGEAINEAIHLTKIVNSYNLNRLIYKAINKSYLERKADYIKITDLGKERLTRLLPKYEHRRLWDGLIYLITYDIPEIKRRERDYLRDCLIQLGCAKLQQSVWLTPYNPKKIISDFVKERKLAGLILVSELKEGSAIGGKDMLEVLAKTYNLNEINEEYDKFISKINDQTLKGPSLLMTYLSILKKDPQLPFELLPSWWMGEEAYNHYKSALKRMRPSLN